MSETYCGKSCDSCEYKISEQCPGCQDGPGNKEFGACELARCCRKKGHDKCSSCRFDRDCYLLRDKEFMPEEMARKTKIELDRQKKMANATPLLAYWINILLWLNIPSLIGVLLNQESVAASMPAVAALGMLISYVTQCVYAIALLKLGAVDKKYKFAGGYLTGSLFVSIVSIALSLFLPVNNEGAQVVIALVSLAATAISFVSVYYEIFAHAYALRGVNNLLGQNWMKLWKYTLIMIGLMFGGSILAVVVAGIATMMILAGSVLSVVVAVLKIKYIYETASVFKAQANRLNNETENIVSEETSEEVSEKSDSDNKDNEDINE